MLQINGMYYKGKIQLEQPFKTKKPIRVVVFFEEEKETEGLSVSDFSFLETQEQLKDFKGSFSKEVIEERRNAI